MKQIEWIIFVWLVLQTSAIADTRINAYASPPTQSGDTTHSGDATNEMPGPWLQLYSDTPGSIVLDATRYQTGQPISMDALLVTLYNSTSHKRRFVSYVNGESSPYGCFYSPANPGLKKNLTVSSDKSCAMLQERAAIKFKNEIESCSKVAGTAMSSKLFVAFDLSSAHCLLAPPRLSGHLIEWTDRLPQNRWVRSGISIGTLNKSVAHSYLDLDEVKVFGCYYYGAPVSYWRNEVSAEETQQAFYSFANEKPVWQKQYLIKTKGFKYDCWDAPRILDEPERILMRLGDGTVLLGGNRSVLRIREKDGSTDAPANLVKAFDPLFVRQVLDEHGAKTCSGSDLATTGRCGIFKSLGWHPEPSEKTFYRLVIKAVDTVLQNLFETTQ